MTGERLFAELRCDTCHGAEGGGRAPSLEGLFGSRVALEGGGQTVADEGYIRESILDPRHRVVMGFRPTMPTFQGQVSEEEVLEVISYIKTLGVARPGSGDEE